VEIRVNNKGVFAVLVGSSMILMWVFLVITGQVPEYEYKPVETLFSISADNITAILLIIGGVGVINEKPWGDSVFLVSMGALFYSLMIAIGYYSQLNQYYMLILFLPLFIEMAFFISGLVKHSHA
jgi:hypothetical protein